MKCSNSSRSRPYYFRRCKQNTSRLTTTSIDSLPYELLFFNILVRLSAEDIYSNAMLVCRKWYNVIRTHDFVQAHLQHYSTPGILVKNFGEPNNHLSLVSIGQGGRIEVYKSHYRMRELDYNWHCCNGLILQNFVNQPRLFNPVTKQVLQIPDHLLDTKTHWMSIACCSRGVYKVVVIYYEGEDEDKEMVLCSIVSVGVDKSWRLVRTQHLSPSSKALLCHGRSYTAPGFIHYICPIDPPAPRHGHSHHKYVVTFNVETETFTENPIPQGLNTRFKFYLSTGTSLYLFPTNSGFYYEVWDMQSETGEWTKIGVLELRPYSCKLKKLCDMRADPLIPIGWLKHKEVVVFRFNYAARFHVAYNVRTHEIDWFKLDSSHPRLYESKAHTSSLVGLA